MAGYHIYSLDWEKFCRFVEHPTRQHLLVLGEMLCEKIEEWEGEFEEGDSILDWPRDVPSLALIAAQRLALEDWYGDLSKWGKVSGRGLW